MIYCYSGGHCVYSGTNVMHYHLSTNRWEQPVPTEEPLGMIAASGQSVPGVSFNGRPWMTSHTWHGYEYSPGLAKMVVVGRLPKSGRRFDGPPDPYFYVYDPDRAEWGSRHSVGEMDNDRFNIYVNRTPRGLLTWTRDRNVWLLDEKAMRWNRLKIDGDLPAPHGDFAGLIHDPVSDRVLFFETGYQTAYSGALHALDLDTGKVSRLRPDGSEQIERLLPNKHGRYWRLREVARDPRSGLLLWYGHLGDGYTPAYDADRNRWVGVWIGGEVTVPGQNAALASDRRRGLFWLVDVKNGDVWALRFDAKKATIKPLREIDPAARPK